MFTTKSVTREATEEHDAMVTHIYPLRMLWELCVFYGETQALSQ